MNKVAKQSKDLYKEKIEQLKAIYPELFSDEGNLNEDELRNFLKQFASTSEGKYEFNWAGKMSAKRNAFTTSRAMLKPDKERSIDFDKTENLIIEGENLEVLKLLQKSYQGKIKCIYIDPPYNTGHDFIYSDNFSEDKKAYWEKSGITQEGVKLDTNTESQGRYHSNWLNMIYPRLLLARNLLKEDGVIFVSIDDNEIHNLRKAMDEIFGEENFVGQLIMISNPRGSQEPFGISTTHEYIAVYVKESLGITSIIGQGRDANDNEFSYEIDGGGKARLLGLRKRGGDWRRSDRPNMYYPFYVNPQTEKVSLEKSSEKDFEVFPKKPNGEESRWTWGIETTRKNLNMLIAKKMTRNGQLTYDIFRIDKLNNEDGTIKRTKLKSVLQDSAYNYQYARQYLLELLGSSELFDFPKAPELIQKLLQSLDSSEDIILDFFAGSGTTAQAVMELNKEDGGNRKFILVQIPEKTDESSEAYKAGYKKISDICIERVKRVSKKLKEEKAKGDLGFKVFTLSPSYFPENLFTPDPEKTEEENKKALAKYIEEASTQLEFKFDEFDLMYEVLLKDGFNLNFNAEKLTEFGKNNIYKVTDGEKHAYLTLDSNIKDETLQKLQKYTGERFICLERAVDTTKKWNLQNMFGSNLWVI